MASDKVTLYNPTNVAVSSDAKDRENKRAEKLSHRQFLYGDVLKTILPSDVKPFVRADKRQHAGEAVANGDAAKMLKSKDATERATGARYVATVPGAAGVRLVLRAAGDAARLAYLNED